MATQTFPAACTDRAAEPPAAPPQYRLVLAALTALIVLSPFLDRREDSWLLTLLSAGVLVTVIVSVRGRRRTFWFAAAIAVANLGANLLTLLTKAPWPMLADGVLGLIFYAFTTWVIFADVMRARRVSADTLCGAVCVYLLLGVTFGLLFYRWM